VKVPVTTLKQLIALAAPVIQHSGGANPLLNSLGATLTELAGQHGSDPAMAAAKQEISAATSAAIAARREAARSARDRLAGR
jgi:hypothetical protein